MIIESNEKPFISSQEILFVETASPPFRRPLIDIHLLSILSEEARETIAPAFNSKVNDKKTRFQPKWKERKNFRISPLFRGLGFHRRERRTCCEMKWNAERATHERGERPGPVPIHISKRPAINLQSIINFTFSPLPLSLLSFAPTLALIVFNKRKNIVNWP